MTVELRHLRAFVAVADKGSVSRAAATLHLSQPAVSRTLAQLEAHLGVRLVDRSTHHLDLTEDGEALLPKARVAIAVTEDALDMRRLHRWPLRLGYAWAALGPHTATLQRRWSRTAPHVPLELHRVDEPSGGLSSGAADVAVLRGTVDLDGLEHAVVAYEDRLAALPYDDPLASQDEVTLEDLATRTVVLNTVSGTTTPKLWPARTRPKEWVETTNTDDWLAAIAAGQGVGVTTAATPTMYANPGVAFVRLAGVDPVPVALAWRRPPTHPLVPDLVALTAAVLATR